MHMGVIDLEKVSFKAIYEMFYKKKKKVLNLEKIKEYLDERALAYWIMDDGVYTGAGIRIATNAFTLNEVSYLKDFLEEKFNLKCTIQEIYLEDRWSLYITKRLDEPFKPSHQWYWSYEYGDNANNLVEFDSYMVYERDLAEGQLRLLEVDNAMVVPVKTHIRLIITSGDVLHSWAIPSFGIKVDAVPGRLNQIGLYVKREGTFYGQCSELCGVDHGFMPIKVEASSFIEKTVSQSAVAIVQEIKASDSPQLPPLVTLTDILAIANKMSPEVKLKFLVDLQQAINTLSSAESLTEDQRLNVQAITDFLAQRIKVTREDVARAQDMKNFAKECNKYIEITTVAAILFFGPMGLIWYYIQHTEELARAAAQQKELMHDMHLEIRSIMGEIKAKASPRDSLMVIHFHKDAIYDIFTAKKVAKEVRLEDICNLTTTIQDTMTASLTPTVINDLTMKEIKAVVEIESLVDAGISREFKTVYRHERL
ncbi:hypothetical protein ACTFIY_009626 [Dictyostelium cf. discoideum]